MPLECMANFDTCVYGTIYPENGEVLSPWVTITLDNPTAAGKGGSISVGNESFPGNPHTACIKDFEYGKSDSFSCRITIHDEQGGSFVNFAEALLKDYRCNVSPMFLSIEYGWVKSVCSSGAYPVNSTKIYAMLQSIETNFTNGKFQYELTGTDQLTIGQEGNSDALIGGDGDEGVYYTDAIRQLATRDPAPRIGSVNWYRVDNNGQILKLGEKDAKFHSTTNDEVEKQKGPKRKWWSLGQDKLDAMYRWTGEVMSEEKKGFIFYFNNEDPAGELQIWVDPKPTCGQNQTPPCLATYIVNGGKESPVIEFNPSFKWDFTRLTSGGGNLSTIAADPTNNDAKTLGRRECPTLSRAGNPGAGHNTTGGTENENLNNETGKSGQNDAQEAADKQFRALDFASSIEADLVVIGDPRLKPIEIMNRFISIIFINPIHLQGPQNSGTHSCPEWTVKPACNPVLSNDAWIVKAVTHKIDAGSYKTILRVKLAVPGSDLDSGDRLGGSQKGWQPPAGCPSKA